MTTIAQSVAVVAPIRRARGRRRNRRWRSGRTPEERRRGGSGFADYDPTVERRSIDWATAVVSPSPPLFELRVRVSPDGVDDEWRSRFNELAKRHGLATHRAPRWGAVELVDETIVVVALHPDGDVELKQTLDALAVATNEELERDRLRREEEERRRAEEDAERARIAEELTQRFRRGTAPAAAPEPLPRPFGRG